MQCDVNCKINFGNTMITFIWWQHSRNIAQNKETGGSSASRSLSLIHDGGNEGGGGMQEIAVHKADMVDARLVGSQMHAHAHVS